MALHKNIGSDFEDFLAEEDILNEVETAAAEKAFVILLQARMKKKRIRRKGKFNTEITELHRERN